MRATLDENESEENELPSGNDKFDEKPSINQKKLLEGKIALIF